MVVSCLTELILAIIEHHTCTRWPITIIPAWSFWSNEAYDPDHPIAAVPFVGSLNLYLVAYLDHVR